MEFISEGYSVSRLSRSRYWKITADEMEKFVYNEEKLMNWEIKCVREPEVDAIFIGVFMYRNGTPYDYESVKGITYIIIISQERSFQQSQVSFKKNLEEKKWKKGKEYFLKVQKKSTPAKIWLH
ncbi:hypothetical protein BG20_I1075 [Candidatus Nitrosarchaeum limnium BG20]|uniref:Uncharacterized protein n=1 Tax=Candidatus Nitrosarchaeum limnium BG20 TaxID=859192 RepID=S2EJN5_9ARCH|nr:hypothetical protein BG20_I1075 [Candidatus Nitrosarchaeum limnium BG20]